MRSRTVTLITGTVGIVFFGIPVFAFAETNKLFYYNGSSRAYESLIQNAAHISILAPQSYNVDGNGILHGKVGESVLGIVRAHQIKLMPLVVNQNFSEATMHAILTSSNVQTTIIQGLVAEAEAKGYWGWQFDFEHMAFADRELYSMFVENSGRAFRDAGLVFSVAMPARYSSEQADYPDEGWFHWSGAFDYSRIGAAVDFVSVMTYDEPNSKGPVASISWMERVLGYTTQHIPHGKISLGLPTYFWRWREKNGVFSGSGGYNRIDALLKSGQYVSRGWSVPSATSWVLYLKDGKKYRTWYEDKRSFEAKAGLVGKYQLHGFSAWVLGAEDPKIWDYVATLGSAPLVTR